MSGEIKFRERVSEDKCYILDSVTREELNQFEDWFNENYSAWIKTKIEVYATHTKEKDTIIKTLCVETSGSGDYNNTDKITITDKPIYILCGYDNISLLTKQDFDEDFEVIEEATE